MPPVAVPLRPHPANACTAVRRIDGLIVLAPDAQELRVSFRAEGDMNRLKLPAREATLRADSLWQHSCFEVFLKPGAGDAYYEFNFSPSGGWAAYRFSGLRAGRESPAMSAPRSEFKFTGDACKMSAAIPLGPLRELARPAAMRAGLAAVVEECDGTLAYWALAHRSPRPDFHDPATFTFRLAES